MKPSKENVQFRDISNVVPVDSHPKGSHYITRRKSQVELLFKKKSMKNEDKSMICYIPMSKISRSASEMFKEVISCPISRANSKENIKDNDHNQSLKKFVRNTEKDLQNPKKMEEPSSPVEMCSDKECLQEKTALMKKMQKIREVNEQLRKENDRLNKVLSETNSKVVQFSEEIKTKTVRMNELREHLSQREGACQQLEEVIRGRDRMIYRLQETIKNLQRQKAPLNVRMKGNESMESVQFIHQLAQKLKYRQMELHLLKKEKYALQELQFRHKVVLQQNEVLKERLNYYIRRTEKPSSLMDSVSSLSFSMISINSGRPNSGRVDGIDMANSLKIDLKNMEGIKQVQQSCF